MMRKDLVPAAEARAILLEGAGPLGQENIHILEAAGRVLSEDIVSRRTQPPFPASAMDGYAVRTEDVSDVPTVLDVIGISAAGHPYKGTVAKGEAVRIFTGGAVPEGADTIVIQEDTKADEGTVEILETAKSNQHIRKAGLDFKEGERLLFAGDLLDPQRLALAASMNCPLVSVYRKPLVGILATGDELVPPGSELSDGQIIASNTFGLSAMIADAGADMLNMEIARDNRRTLIDKFEEAIAAGADLIVTTGGASVGDHDLVFPVLSEMGAEFHFSKIAMKPGKPFLSGFIMRESRKIRLLGLAGNPVSSIVAGYMFVRPLVNALAGRQASLVSPVACILGCDIPPNGPREDYQRASAERSADGQIVVTPLDVQDSSMLAALVRSDALLVRLPEAPAAKTGDPAMAVLLRDI
ncbi:MAG: gephyrin-like molybdotransferase Glp [Pseudomonadota bacterium]